MTTTITTGDAGADLETFGQHLLTLTDAELAEVFGRAASHERAIIANALHAARGRGQIRRRMHDAAAQADARRAVFARLGYEPNCKPRIDAARALGFRWPADAVRAGVAIPDPCGACPQEQFHAATEYDVFYGGAAGGGKTRAMLMDAIADAMAFPRLTVGLFRESYPELRLSFITQLARLGFAATLGARWNTTNHELTFPNGSVMVFAFAATEKDAGKYLSAEFQKLVIDERTKMDPAVVDMLYERVRSSLDDVPVLGVRSASNPGNAGHGAVKARYVDATNYGEHLAVDDVGRDVRFIPSKATDNPHLDDGYLAVLHAITDPARRAAMLDGSWDSFAGQVFGEWRRERHVVTPFPIPPTWERLDGIDYGYAAPWCVLWAAVDNDERVWIYREIYETGVGQTEQARRILEAEGDEDIRHRAADPSMWAKIGEENSMAEVYMAAGVDISKANNDRISGWARVHHFLSEGPACVIHRAMGWETCPRLHVFGPSCPNLTRTLPTLPYDPRRVEDVDTRAEDHAADALRYLLLEVGSHGPTTVTSPAHRQIRVPHSSTSSAIRSPFGGR